MATAEASAASTEAEARTPGSKRLTMFLSCVDSLNLKLTEEYKECIHQLFGPCFESHPQYVDKICEAFMKSFNQDVKKRLNRFLQDNKVAQKLKELEDISEQPCEGVSKAWRPTGKTAFQHQLAPDIEVKVKMMEKLKLDLAKEESKLKDLMATVEKQREEYKKVKETLETYKNRKEELIAELEYAEKIMFKGDD
ncbi:uncharacterized protein LOC132192656 [Neocloeon triangulifer]|uniref:uncharacterized protein LOC132192656 n=1 Tax=Neocloeon triangulifer TaxID=2078957 RepID=UPI00286F11FC|nr:uncharacterized protein LOC132192656 [Neocloeon triangulifer]XP_059468698.1 uncharacterized protein LOC132192656 [Neocloeon triangulifer]